ncbi:hypothetical protein JTE90_001030 [Oedothorax gibbosus]|uniref:Uncharacterized protein n=1 Tax=Oedothorax gibbosus TaxID=931172 RepID=A0AAV6TNZ8_9ARAC|nr:hypothetical protein JTE90_001030 [Oedothorax gibbosus]
MLWCLEDSMGYKKELFLFNGTQDHLPCAFFHLGDTRYPASLTGLPDRSLIRFWCPPYHPWCWGASDHPLVL